MEDYRESNSKMAEISTANWPKANLACDFRIIKKDGNVFLIEFGNPNKRNNEMTIVSQVALKADTLKDLMLALCAIQ